LPPVEDRPRNRISRDQNHRRITAESGSTSIWRAARSGSRSTTRIAHRPATSSGSPTGDRSGIEVDGPRARVPEPRRRHSGLLTTRLKTIGQRRKPEGGAREKGEHLYGDNHEPSRWRSRKKTRLQAMSHWAARVDHPWWIDPRCHGAGEARRLAPKTASRTGRCVVESEWDAVGGRRRRHWCAGRNCAAHDSSSGRSGGCGRPS
jgi:hypothetical protein